MMKKNPIKIILMWIIIGILIGSLIGITGASGLIPNENYLSITSIVIELCIGAIVFLVDIFCIWALLRPTIIDYIDRNGESAIGKIKDIAVITHPNQLGEDDWVQKVRYALTVSYKVCSKEYRKEYPPTCLTSKQELYPQIIEVGKDIPIKFYKKVPYFSLIDIDFLKTRLKKEQNNARVHFVMIPIIITIVYLIAIIYNVI